MPYATPGDVRTRYPSVADSSVYSDALLADLIDEFEQIAEEYRGIAFLARTVTETVTIGPGQTFTTLVVDHAPVISVSAFTFNGVAIARYTLDKRYGVISNIYNLTSSVATSVDLTITYSHGLAAPPTPILRACKMYARNAAKADVSGTTRDVLTQADGQGGSTRYSTPDWHAGRPTGWLEVDRLLNSVTDLRVPAAG